jgi:hypothetical protein
VFAEFIVYLPAATELGVSTTLWEKFFAREFFLKVIDHLAYLLVLFAIDRAI